MSSDRDNKGRWAPGTSGNPAGRPPLTAEARAALERLTGLADSAVDAVQAALGDPDINLRLRAAGVVLDRAYGKPTQLNVTEQRAPSEEPLEKQIAMLEAALAAKRAAAKGDGGGN